MQEILKPMDIEKRSFEIISQEIGSVDLNEKELLVLKREIGRASCMERVSSPV